jgi:hypothetical protein
MRVMRNAYILDGDLEGNIPIRSPRRRREDDIKISIKEGGVDWIHLTHNKDRWRDFVNTVMNLRAQ